MPRVGSLSRMTFGLVISHLAMTTFCWLPPDKVPTGTAVPSVLIPSSAIISSIALLSAARSMRPTRDSCDSEAKERLSRTDIGSIRPSVLRSSGISAMPSRGFASLGLRQRRLRAVDPHLAGNAAQHAEQRQQQLALALAVEAAEADDLAGARGQRNVLAAGRSRRDCAPPAPARRSPAFGAGFGGKTGCIRGRSSSRRSRCRSWCRT